MKKNELQQFLDQQYAYYQNHFDIAADPLSIPKQFNKLQDIEISGFFAATIAWGNRKAIVKAANHLMQLMDHAPYDFVLNHTDTDLKRIMQFYYRTFNATDILYFIAFLKHHYRVHISLETAFVSKLSQGGVYTAYQGLSNFYDHFFSLDDAPDRTRKHIGNVKKQSACKRLNMFLRWMVRNDAIDFGIWKQIPKAQLICPLDIHVQTVATKLELLHRTQSDWKAALALTEQLQLLDPEDPVKYDIVLFSLGVEHKM